MTTTSDAPTISPEQRELNKDSDTVHEEGKYADEYSRTHGQPRSQRDPTMFKNTDQDNLIDISANNSNIGTYFKIFFNASLYSFISALTLSEFDKKILSTTMLNCSIRGGESPFQRPSTNSKRTLMPPNPGSKNRTIPPNSRSKTSRTQPCISRCRLMLSQRGWVSWSDN